MFLELPKKVILFQLFFLKGKKKKRNSIVLGLSSTPLYSLAGPYQSGPTRIWIFLPAKSPLCRWWFPSFLISFPAQFPPTAATGVVSPFRSNRAFRALCFCFRGLNLILPWYNRGGFEDVIWCFVADWKMPREDVENGREDMLIDGSEAKQQKQKNAVPDVFNAHYLKVYYGIFTF